MRVLPLLSLALLASCLKPSPPPKAAPGTTLQLASVLDSFDDTSVTGLPERLEEELREALVQRAITPVAPDSSILTAYADLRSTESRISWLGAQPSAPALLVTCAPRFSAQVNGRYRWSVDVSLSITGIPTQSFSVPAHLLYAHEDEDEAAIEAAPIIVRRLGQMLDEWISSRNPSP